MLRAVREFRLDDCGWFVVGITLALMVYCGHAKGWDTAVYRQAIGIVHSGQSPYVVGLAAQQRAGDVKALTYAYGPLTLPLLRGLGYLPPWTYGSLFWLLYSAGAIVPCYVMQTLAFPSERRAVRWLAPFSVLFPGLMFSGVLLGGNVVYILYGAIFGAAWLGWRRNHWGLFYAAVLLACSVKPHLLTLLVIPLFSGAGQALLVIVTGAAGTALLTAQRWMFPVAMHDYLHYTQELLARYDHQLGMAPVGWVAAAMRRHGGVNSHLLMAFFVVYAAIILLALWHGSRLYRARLVPLEAWVPVLLAGVVLLNPRLIDYDLSPITIPLGLILWRLLLAMTGSWQKSAALGMVLLLPIHLTQLPDAERAMLMTILFSMFILGLWRLRQQSLHRGTGLTLAQSGGFGASEKMP